jgi:hypothetical protein
MDQKVLSIKNLSEFYQHAVHVIYAVLISQSFFTAKDVFIPLSNLKTYDGFVNALALIFAYFFIITGWIGWYKSISKNPHGEGRLGIARFGTDLFIMFLFYYLLSLASPTKMETYGDTFVWVLPIIYGVYFLWDGLKYFEYKHELVPERRNRKNRSLITFLFFSAFVIQSVVYVHVMKNLHDLNWSGNTAWNPIFIIFSFTLTAFYRRRKWLVKHKRRNKRTKRSNSKA